MTKTASAAPSTVKRWGRQRFINEFSASAAQGWGIPVHQIRFLEQVIANWLNETPLKAVELRSKSSTAKTALEELDARQIIRTREDGVYRPSFLAIAVANAQGARGVRDLTSVCQKVFDAARSIFRRKPTNSFAIYKDFRSSLAIEDHLLKSALDVLNDSGLGINFSATAAPPTVYVSEQVIRCSSIWEYFAATVGNRSNPFGQALGFLDFGSISHFDEILALVHDGSELARKAVTQINADPGAAITASRSLLEASLMWLLHDAGLESPTTATPAALLKQCLPYVGLDKEHTSKETGIGQMLLGMGTSLHGLARMRDELSDAHGRKPGTVSATRTQARLAVGLAIAVSCFLVEAREAHKVLCS